MTTGYQVISDVTIDLYKRTSIDSATTHKALLGILKEKGRFETVTGGEALSWPFQASFFDNYIVDDGQDVSSTYVSQKQDLLATLPWGEIFTPIKVTKGEMRRNRGEPALVNLMKTKFQRAFKSLFEFGTNSLNYKIINGTGAAAGADINGLMSMFKFDNVASTVAEPTITSGATYAGQSMAIGTVAGLVDGSADNYAWTPRAYNTTVSTGSTTGDKFLEGVRTVQLNLTFSNGDPEMMPDLVLTGKTVFNALRAVVDAKQTIFITKPDEGKGTWGLGNSPERFWYGGLWFTWDSDVPTKNSTDLAFVLNCDRLKFVSQKAVGPVSADRMPDADKGDDMGISVEVEQAYNPDRRAVTASLTLPGQLMADSPRYHGVVGDYTA